MTLRRIVEPVYRIDCDGDGCNRFSLADDEYGRCYEYAARQSAREYGWQVRPNRGKGSRSAPDLCPSCKPPEVA